MLVYVSFVVVAFGSGFFPVEKSQVQCGLVGAVIASPIVMMLMFSRAEFAVPESMAMIDSVPEFRFTAFFYVVHRCPANALAAYNKRQVPPTPVCASACTASHRFAYCRVAAYATRVCGRACHFDGYERY